jgi:hypothetical protein
MKESNESWLYLWQHCIVLDDGRIVTRTCFGITGNKDNRQNNYEGHVGHTIEFKDTWKGPKRPIKDLEDHIKGAFHDYLVVGHRGFRYEWINEEIPYQQIVDWITWELQDQTAIIKDSAH